MVSVACQRAYLRGVAVGVWRQCAWINPCNPCGSDHGNNGDRPLRQRCRWGGGCQLVCFFPQSNFLAQHYVPVMPTQARSGSISSGCLVARFVGAQSFHCNFHLKANIVLRLDVLPLLADVAPSPKREREKESRWCTFTRERKSEKEREGERERHACIHFQ